MSPISNPCAAPLCYVHAVKGSRYCEKHRPEEPRTGFSSEFKQKDRFYDRRDWKRLRLVIIAKRPICERCDRKPSEVVHHKLRRKDRPDLAFDPDNLEALCIGCHNAESQAEGAAQRARR